MLGQTAVYGTAVVDEASPFAGGWGHRFVLIAIPGVNVRLQGSMSDPLSEMDAFQAALGWRSTKLDSNDRI